MGMTYVLKQASDATIQTLLANPVLITDFLFGDDLEQPESLAPRKPPGFFARLFGARDPSAELATTASLDKFETDLEELDLDKSWHGIHFLLTGSEWESEPPEGFLLVGGNFVGSIDVGYSPARAYTAGETAQINACLTSLAAETICQRFDPQRMMELEIYPTTWMRDRDCELGYLIDYFESLKDFVAKTTDHGYGMVSRLW